MKRRLLLYGALLLLYALHNDLWLRDDPDLVLGLPVGLTYHVGYVLAVSLLMFLLVKWAWPRHLEVREEQSEARVTPPSVGPPPEGTVPRGSRPGREGPT